MSVKSILKQAAERLVSLEESVIGKENQLEKAVARAASLEQVIQEKDCQLREAGVTTVSLTQILADKDIRLGEIKGLHETINSLETELSLMKKSIIYQFTTKFHTKVVERIFPFNTQRRKSYDTILMGGRKSPP